MILSWFTRTRAIVGSLVLLAVVGVYQTFAGDLVKALWGWAVGQLGLKSAIAITVVAGIAILVIVVAIMLTKSLLRRCRVAEEEQQEQAVRIAELQAHIAADRSRREQRIGAIIEATCRAAIVSLSPRPEHVASVVFLPDENGVLQSAFTYNKRNRPDSGLRFEKWQGATGHAWGSKDPTLALLDEAPPDDLRERWKLTPEQIGLTSYLKVVLATPIRAGDDPDRLIGVVSIDSDLPVTECGLDTEKALSETLQLAQLLARVLESLS